MKALMVQGTTSDAGKSTLVAGLCRVLARKGVSVAPYKPQNMALNSAVTLNGGEIGRAQAVQALACGIEPHTDMNPVLIKPSSDTGAQIIIHGQAFTNMDAQNYHAYKPVAKKAVLESFQRLQSEYQTVVIEGAGSPAEINLREGDIANMGFAESVDCPVVLIADIDKGGVFAHIVGTLSLLSESEQARIVGFVINRFRGDIALLQSGLDWLEERTNKPVLAVLPYLHNFYLESEDAIDASQHTLERGLNVVVPVLPRISNHTDFDALRLHPQVNLTFVNPQSPPPACDLIILPGSKNVREDCKFLMQHGWLTALQKHLRYGGKVLGICGGYQMLGQMIKDPLGVEATAGEQQSFGLLPTITTLKKKKTLTRIAGTISINNAEVAFKGYEIHHGQTEIVSGVIPKQPMPFSFCVEGDSTRIVDGYLSDDNQVLGGYSHGLFDEKTACDAILQWAGLEGAASVNVKAVQEEQIDRLADAIEEAFNFNKLQCVLDSFNSQKNTNL